MRILQVHNRYLYAGGEDVIAEREKQLLISHGHEVVQFQKDNKDIETYSLFQKTSLLWKTAWSGIIYGQIRANFRESRPDICHVHNFFPLVSPSIYYACDELKIPVVQTLHNYRLLCVNAYLFRNGHVCEECIGRTTYHSLRYGCYHDSVIQSFAVANMIQTHRKRQTWNEKVDAYICLSEFSKGKFVDGGLPEQKLFLKPNFLEEDPGVSRDDGGYVLFAGRLEESKGIQVLLEAAKQLPSLMFKVAGDGPLQKRTSSALNVELLGRLAKQKLMQSLKKASLLVSPSILYENMPLIICEAFANGKPVIASRLGAMAEMVTDGKTGLLFEAGNAQDLAAKISWAVSHKDEMRAMGMNARKVFEQKYSAETNYTKLMAIYSQAVENRRNRKK